MTDLIRTPKIYFASLQLKNVRCFAGRQELKLTDSNGRISHWSLILGENGVGKTTLLRCLARMRPLPETSTDEGEPDQIQPELLSETSNQVLASFIRDGADVMLNMQANFAVGVPLGASVKDPSRLRSCISLQRRKGELEGSTYEGSSTNVRLASEPFVVGYGAARHMGFQNFDAGRLSDSTASLFDTSTQLYDAEEVLVQMDYGALKRGARQARRLKQLKRALADILPDISKPEDIRIFGPEVPGDKTERSGVYIMTPYGAVPIAQLSLGSQTALALTVDLAWRLFQQYPKSKDPLTEPAIALIDEVDLHLHPKWQREIRQHLVSNFPNVQFIVTAHSPLMAQAALDTNLAVLKQVDDHVVIENDPVVIGEWRVDQVLTSELFGLKTARSSEVEELLLERKKLLEQRRLTDANKKRLKELDRKLSDLPTAELPENQKAMDIIREAASLLQKDSK